MDDLFNSTEHRDAELTSGGEVFRQLRSVALEEKAGRNFEPSFAHGDRADFWRLVTFLHRLGEPNEITFAENGASDVVVGELVVGDDVDKISDAAAHDRTVRVIVEVGVDEFFCPAAGAWSSSITVTFDIGDDFRASKVGVSHLLLIRFPSRRRSTR